MSLRLIRLTHGTRSTADRPSRIIPTGTFLFDCFLVHSCIGGSTNHIYKGRSYPTQWFRNPLNFDMSVTSLGGPAISTFPPSLLP